MRIHYRRVVTFTDNRGSGLIFNNCFKVGNPRGSRNIRGKYGLARQLVNVTVTHGRDRFIALRPKDAPISARWYICPGKSDAQECVCFPPSFFFGITIPAGLVRLAMGRPDVARNEKAEGTRRPRLLAPLRV